MRARRVVIVIDRSTLEWTVVEYHRTGWTVLARFDNQHDAHLYRRSII